MRRKRHSEEQIIGALKRHESGVRAADICRELGIAEQTFYRWRSKYGGMDVSEARRLRSLEDENGRLKRMLADQMLENAAIKDVLAKKW